MQILHIIQRCQLVRFSRIYYGNDPQYGWYVFPIKIPGFAHFELAQIKDILFIINNYICCVMRVRDFHPHFLP